MRYASKADAENIRSRPITETRPIKANRNKDNTGIKSTKNMIYRLSNTKNIFQRNSSLVTSARNSLTYNTLRCDELFFKLITNITFYGKITAV